MLPHQLHQAIDHASICNQSCSCTAPAKTVGTEPGSRIMLLDCRSFMQFNMKHICGSLNVNITSIGKKRLMQGKTTLVDLVMSEAGKEYLKNGNWVTAVVYDESTSDLAKAPSSHPVRLVMDQIQKDGKQAYLLKGGIKEFTECYHSMSNNNEGDPPSPIPTTAIERINLMAECEKEATLEKPPSACPLSTSITEVLPSLYLGNAMDAANGELLTSSNIRYILNLTKTCPNYFLTDPEYKYKQIKIEDSCREDIKGIVEEAIEFIDLAKSNDSGVLIHCQGGVSRSPTVTIAYIMHLNGLSLSDAYEFVKTRRPCIAPNLNFMGQLLEMEQANSRSK